MIPNDPAALARLIPPMTDATLAYVDPDNVEIDDVAVVPTVPVNAAQSHEDTADESWGEEWPGVADNEGGQWKHGYWNSGSKRSWKNANAGWSSWSSSSSTAGPQAKRGSWGTGYKQTF